MLTNKNIPPRDNYFAYIESLNYNISLVILIIIKYSSIFQSAYCSPSNVSMKLMIAHEYDKK